MSTPYTGYWRTFVVVVALMTLAASPVGAARSASPPKAKAKAKRCEVVVFRRRGKTIRRCRLKRAVPPAPRPALTPPPSPTAVDQPLPPARPEEPHQPQPVPQAPAPDVPEKPAQRDPWFLTLHARDVGNGDFRLTPNIGSIPAGTLYLSYKNDDAAEHDLRLRGISPASAERLIFPASSTKELREAELRLDPGRYEFRCGLLGHEEMRQDFDVTP